MASYTITTKSGLPDFIRLFTEAVVAGKRFKTVNFPESEKDSITSLGDYNFYTILREFPILTSGNNWTVTFEDDAYVLLRLVVVPPIDAYSLFGILDSGRTNGGTLGTLLMAIQHIAGVYGFDTVVTPSKSTIDGFITLVSTITRNLINFRAVMQSYVSIPEVTATGDFEFTDSFYFTRQTLHIFGNTSDFSGRLRILSDGSVSFRTNLQADVISAPAGTVPVNRASSISVSRTGTTFTLEVGSFSTTTTEASVTAITPINALLRNAGNYSDGFSYNTNFVSGFTQTGNPAGNPIYPLDGTLVNSNVIRNSAATLGSELVQESNISLGASWAIVGGNLVYSGTGTDFVVITVPGLVNGGTYQSDITATSGTFRDRFDRDRFTGVSASGRAFQYSGGQIRIQSNSEPCVIPISQISLQEAPGYGTAFGLGAADSEPYTDLPAELVQVANTAEQTFPPGVLSHNFSGFVPAADYRVLYSPASTVNTRLIGAAGNPTITAGETSHDFSQGTGTLLGLNSQGVASNGFTASFKRILRKAP